MTILGNDIVKFWFEDIDKSLWFGSTAKFDNELRERFEEVYLLAVNAELKTWQESAEGCLALVILLDQFPLNMYRGKPESFASEGKARDVAKYAIDKKYDLELSKPKKAFLYMPYMHSENLDDQDFSVSLYKMAGLDTNLRFALHHRSIVERFGRFPHRNSILGRNSTEEEINYLNSDNAFTG